VKGVHVQVALSPLAQLHDATLRAIRLDWSTGDLHLELSAALHEGSSSHVLLQATEVTLLRCPRQAPWGWSVSVNEVRTTSTQSGRTRLEVEVQRGEWPPPSRLDQRD
jgi:hypothetical protein